MGFFGSSDDSEAENNRGGDDAVEDGDNHASKEGIEAEVSALVEQVLSGQGGEQNLSDIVSRLDGSTQAHIVSARVLGRVAQQEQGVLAADIERILDRLAGRELAGPIAESLLGSAHEFGIDGMRYEDFADGALDALAEAENRIDDLALTAHEVPGGGASEVALGMELRDYAETVRGRDQLVVEATADALEAVPRALARRAGLDPIDAIVDMRAKSFGDDIVGVDLENGSVRDATGSTMSIPKSDLRLRLTDGVTLGAIVCCTKGTVSQLEVLTGREPYPE